LRKRWNRQPDHFFTFGNARRALHPDKKSWMLFAAAHAGMWASTVIAARNHRTSMEGAHSEYPAAAFMTGIDLPGFQDDQSFTVSWAGDIRNVPLLQSGGEVTVEF
jgi:hypothetical protein